MSERLGPSQEPPRQSESSKDPLIGFATSPGVQKLLEYAAPFACAVAITRGTHFVVDANDLAKNLSGAATEQEKQQAGKVYKGLGVALAGGVLFSFSHI